MDCHRITNSAWKRCIVKPIFERDLINAERDVMYKKRLIEVLYRQLQIANVNEDVYFQLFQSRDLDAIVHHPKESNLFLDIYNQKKDRSDVF